MSDDVERLYDQLIGAAGLRGQRAVIRIGATYRPAGGDGSKVHPPTFPLSDGQPYLLEERLVDGRTRSDVLLDSAPSQANRAEAALLRARRAGLIDVPLLELRHVGAAQVVLTSLEFPHRYADAYVRDSLLDGERFDRTELGKALQGACLDDASAVYRHDPGSLVFGAWNSHRSGRQAKFPRVYASEVVGWDPQAGRRNAGRMDPLNLVGAVRRNGTDWSYLPLPDKARSDKLSAIGHGNIAPNAAAGGVTISSATRLATLSFAGLNRIGFGATNPAAADAARAVLAAYALLADRLAFGGPSLWLRSGCELICADERIEWVSRGGVTEPVPLDPSGAQQLFAHAVDRAAEAGLPLAEGTITLTPSPPLAEAIDFALTKVPAGER
jgi:CRISPR-associated protein Csb1